METGAQLSAFLFMLTSMEYLSLYFAGSRRPTTKRGTRALHGFLTRYFPAFNRDIRDEHGHVNRVTIPLLREGGKARKRLRIPSALIHLFRRGALEDLLAPSDPDNRCVTLGQGRWGFTVDVRVFFGDFLHSLDRYREDALSDRRLAENYLRRFNHLYG